MAGINAKSQDWRLISEWAGKELARYRDLNDIPGTDTVLTEGYRGAIEVLKELLALPSGAAPMVPKKTGNNYDMGVR